MLTFACRYTWQRTQWTNMKELLLQDKHKHRDNIQVFCKQLQCKGLNCTCYKQAYNLVLTNKEKERHLPAKYRQDWQSWKKKWHLFFWREVGGGGRRRTWTFYFPQVCWYLLWYCYEYESRKATNCWCLFTVKRPVIVITSQTSGPSPYLLHLPMILWSRY